MAVIFPVSSIHADADWRFNRLHKQGYKELQHLIQPHAVIPIKLGDRVIPAEVVTGAIGFTFLYIVIFFAVSLAMTFLGLDIVSAISSVAATLGNIGPGLGIVGQF